MAKEVRELLSNTMVSQAVTLTIDHWTSTSKQNYCGMTAHFINKTWDLKSHVLGCCKYIGISYTKYNYVVSLFLFLFQFSMKVNLQQIN